jgi:hypothetical protein
MDVFKDEWCLEAIFKVLMKERNDPLDCTFHHSLSVQTAPDGCSSTVYQIEIISKKCTFTVEIDH